MSHGKNVKRILVIRFSSLGDIILLTPLFREIKKQFPRASLDFLTSTTFAPLCAHDPHLDHIVAFDRSSEKTEIGRIGRLIQEQKYDVILDAHYSMRSRYLLLKSLGLSYIAGRRVISIDKRSWKRNLLLAAKINLMKDAPSQREAYGKLLQAIAPDSTPELHTELFPDDRDTARVHSILQQFDLKGKRLVALGPGASFQGKCWPKENFLALSEQLSRMGCKIVILGGAEDEEGEWIEAHGRHQVADFCGKLSFLETAAMLSECELSVSNDSAIVHFSEAMGTPSIAIFGPTVKEFGYGPFLEQSRLVDISLACRPCSRNGKGKCHNPVQRQCLRDITVARVLQEAMAILSL